MKRKSKITEVTHCLIKLIVTISAVCIIGYFVGVCEFSVAKKRSSILEDIGNFVDGGVGIVRQGYDLIK